MLKQHPSSRGRTWLYFWSTPSFKTSFHMQAQLPILLLIIMVRRRRALRPSGVRQQPPTAVPSAAKAKSVGVHAAVPLSAQLSSARRSLL